MTARVGILTPEGTVSHRLMHPSETAVLDTAGHVAEAHPEYVVWVESATPRTTSSRVETCDAYARRGTGTGMCNAPLDDHGACSRAGQHIEGA